MTETQRELWKIRAAVIGWLRYERHCPLVCFERSPFEERCRPDVIGVTRNWRVVEVEIKQSMTDFKANGEKRGLKLRYQFPQQFYFAVPWRLAKPAFKALPKDAGLIYLDRVESKFGPEIVIGHSAPINRAASRLSKYQAMRMVMHQSGTLHRAVLAVSKGL